MLIYLQKNKKQRNKRVSSFFKALFHIKIPFWRRFMSTLRQIAPQTKIYVDRFSLSHKK